MPNKPAAKKAIRQAITRNQRNKKIKDSLKSLAKKAKKAVESKRFDEAQELMKQATKSFAMAAQKKILKSNTAARHISRLQKMLNQKLGSK